jgi:potassium/chloride transporter 9
VVDRYAITNLACFILKISGAPNFRPRFRQFSWHTSFAGFAACISVMFFIDAVYASAAIMLFLLILAVIHFRQPVTHIPTLARSSRTS